MKVLQVTVLNIVSFFHINQKEDALIKVLA